MSKSFGPPEQQARGRPTWRTKVNPVPRGRPVALAIHIGTWKREGSLTTMCLRAVLSSDELSSQWKLVRRVSFENTTTLSAI